LQQGRSPTADDALLRLGDDGAEGKHVADERATSPGNIHEAGR
jgi:hypothetical protein